MRLSSPLPNDSRSDGGRSTFQILPVNIHCRNKLVGHIAASTRYNPYYYLDKKICHNIMRSAIFIPCWYVVENQGEEGYRPALRSVTTVIYYRQRKYGYYLRCNNHRCRYGGTELRDPFSEGRAQGPDL